MLDCEKHTKCRMINHKLSCGRAQTGSQGTQVQASADSCLREQGIPLPPAAPGPLDEWDLSEPLLQEVGEHQDKK